MAAETWLKNTVLISPPADLMKWTVDEPCRLCLLLIDPRFIVSGLLCASVKQCTCLFLLTERLLFDCLGQQTIATRRQTIQLHLPLQDCLKLAAVTAKNLR